MRFLSMIGIDETTGQKPSERLMQEMGTLIEEMIRDGSLVRTAGLRPHNGGQSGRIRRMNLGWVLGAEFATGWSPQLPLIQRTITDDPSTLRATD